MEVPICLKWDKNHIRRWSHASTAALCGMASCIPKLPSVVAVDNFLFPRIMSICFLRASYYQHDLFWAFCFFLLAFIIKSIISFPQSGECVCKAGAGCLHAESRSILCSCSGLPHRWLPGYPLWDIWPAPNLWWGWGINSFNLFILYFIWKIC